MGNRSTKNKKRGMTMTALRERAQALETQFARQAELQFKVDARVNRMAGRWAGYTMGLDDVEAYAQTLTIRQVVEPHRLLDLLRQDFCKAGVKVSDADIDRRIHVLSEQASAELYSFA